MNPLRALVRIKVTALTMTEVKDGLAHIIRLCIDAGISDQYPELQERGWQKYNGPKLRLSYTDGDDLCVIHRLEMTEGYSITVVGNPENATYEWVIERKVEIEHSDCGYGDPDTALRDGLILMHGLPEGAIIGRFQPA